MIRIRPIIVIVLACILAEQAGAGMGEWRNFSSKREVRGVVMSGNTIWAATSGGLFARESASGTYTEITAAEGLRSIDLTAIAVDANGTIWTGASNGFVHSFNPASGEWTYISSIAQRSDPQKRINALLPRGDTLYILSDIGVSIFLMSRLEFGDTYFRFGTYPAQITGGVTSLAVSAGSIWVATRTGIASTPLSNPNPSAPESWQIYTSAQGLPFNATSSLSLLHDTLYAGTSRGVALFNGTSWEVVSGTFGYDIGGMAPWNSGCGTCGLAVISSSRIYRLDGSAGMSLVYDAGVTLSAVWDSSVVGTLASGVLLHTATGWQEIVPPGPLQNKFLGMTVDNDGSLWAGTGPVSVDGFMRFNGSSWRTYSPATDTILGTTGVGGGTAYQIDPGPGNSKWVSLFGNGFAAVNASGEIERTFTALTGLPYTSNDPDNRRFVVGAGAATDRGGNVWLNIRSAKDRRLLAIYTPGVDTLRHVLYPNTVTPILTNITIDTYGTFWFTSTTEAGKPPSPGLVFYDPTLRLPGRLADTTGWGIVSDADGLTANNITAVAVDLDGNLWAGTPDAGINIIIDPTNARNRILVYHPLRDRKINDILVDPLNNKWVATDNGVYVLSPDGTSILDLYSVSSTNGRLPDDRVVSLAMDRKNGTIYFGTERGLASLTTAAITPAREFSELDLAPNPFYLPASGQLTVSGLVQGSSIKIFTSSGTLIRQLATPGGNVGFWDGRDAYGDVVGTGIYFVVAYSEDGTLVAKAKLAVLRK